MTTYTTVGGYAALIGLGGIIYLVSQRKTAKGPRTKLSSKQTKVVEKEKEKPTKAKKTRKDSGPSSGSQDVEKTDAVTQKVEKLAPQETLSNGITSSDNDDGMNNREFAKQLSSAKSGTLLQAKTSEGSRQKSVKQSRAQEKEKAAVIDTSSDATAPSSATGGDADDDQSSVNSLELVATRSDTEPTTREAVGLTLQRPETNILKITAPATNTLPPRSNAPASFQPAETKKQRQNRKKAELKKAERDADEKERKVLLEKQRRTAREAEGRAAKDGSSFMASKAPTSSAWAAPPSPPSSPEEKPAKATSNSKIELLDTYEPSSSKAGASSNSESEQVSGGWQKLASSLSEEDQLRLAMEESDRWETVPDKRNKKKSKTTPAPIDSSPDKKENSRGQQERLYGPPEVITPTGPGQKWNVTLEATKPNGEKVEWEREIQDSEWDVAGYGP